MSMELVQLKGPEIEFEENKIIELIKKSMLIAYVFLETLYKTIFGKYLMIEMERLQCVVGAVLACLLLIEWFRLDKDNKIKWVKRHTVIFIYFAIRIITFINIGLQYTMLRSVFFEGLYLLVITELILNSNFCKKYIIKGFILVNLILNIANTIIYWYCEYIVKIGEYASNDSVLFKLLLEITYISDAKTMFMTPAGPIPAIFYSSMYSNANFIGMFTGLAMICALNYVNHDNKIKMIIYYLFSLYCVLYSNCSSAQLALIIVLIVFFIVKIYKKISKKRVVLVFLICCALSSFMIFSIAEYHEEQGVFTEFEAKIESVSSQRYSLWKDCYYSHKEEMLFGCGNLVLEKKDRYQYLLEKGIDSGIDIESSIAKFPGPHNGYIGIISCTGIIGFISYIFAVSKKIIDSRSLGHKYWYLAIIFILIINIFECMVIINKNAICMYMFLIIAMQEDDSITFKSKMNERCS